jgi:hypothetical protein
MMGFFAASSNRSIVSQAIGEVSNLFFMIGGQSNALGITYPTEPSPEYQGSITNAYMEKNNAFETLNYPDNNNGYLFGVEMAFAKEYVDLTGRPLYIAKQANSGLGIAVKEGVANDFNVSTNEIISGVRQKMNLLKSQSASSENPKLVVYWTHGETDAKDGTHVEYYQNMKDILNDINAIWQIDLCVLTVLTDGIIGTDYPAENVNTVRSAQQQLAAEFEWCENLDMNNYARPEGNVHFTGAAQEQIALDVLNICKTKFNL